MRDQSTRGYHHTFETVLTLIPAHQVETLGVRGREPASSERCCPQEQSPGQLLWHQGWHSSHTLSAGAGNGVRDPENPEIPALAGLEHSPSHTHRGGQRARLPPIPAANRFLCQAREQSGSLAEIMVSCANISDSSYLSLQPRPVPPLHLQGSSRGRGWRGGTGIGICSRGQGWACSSARIVRSS